MPQPLVLISADRREFNGVPWHAVQEPYLEASLNAAGVLPLILPAFGASRLDLDRLLRAADGVLLTGSRSNIDPSHYGEAATEEMGPYDRERDATILPLIRAALDKGMPLLAICRGMQELNVALGGTLASEIQDIEGNLDHRGAGPDRPEEERYAIRHPVEIRAGGCLARIVGTGSIAVNSLHRQAVGRLADRLVVEALAPDGVIEAASVRDARGFVLATQWHPEYWAATDAPSAKIFAAFGEAVRDYQRGRHGQELAAE